MGRSGIALATVVAAVAILAIATAVSPAVASERPPQASNVIDGQYIVVYEDSAGMVSAATDERERRLGFESELRYRTALRGFSAELSSRQVRKLRRDPKIDFVSKDRRAHATGEVPLVPGEPTPPTGIRRIAAATATTARQSGPNVAVIDTGIQLNHPDLNAADGKNCVSPGSPANDGNGHGTHVAGSIGAKNNGAGVVGVAPNTKTYAVKVLSDSGSGSFSQIVCGIDWVTANHDALNIKVANMSLGGLGASIQSCATTTDAMHKAICNSTAAGVNYVVAAGNDGWDFDFASVPDVPAAYPQVLTVTALSDSDGVQGGTGGAPSCRSDNQPDDGPASFSNFAATAAGAAHTIAAPGVCIKSTWPQSLGDKSGYNTISGTSMASPHMAGVVALCINEAGIDGACANLTPAEVITQMRSQAQTYNTTNPAYGFLRDPLHSPISGMYYGFLTRVPQSSGTPPPTNTSPPAISGTAREGQTLSTSTGTWTGDPPISYAYQWRRCDSNGASCSNISGATSANYKLTAADVGRRLRALVTASNPGGQKSASSNPSALVAAAPPDTIIDSGPAGGTNDPTPTFAFHSTKSGSIFQCKVDAGVYSSCSSPRTLAHLADGAHTFNVRATAGGATDPTPATRSFTVRTAQVLISGSKLVVTAAAGAKDNLVVTRPSASTLRVTDLAASPYTGSGIHTGAGCTRSGDYTANCSSAGITLIQATGGDQIDKMVNSTALASSLNGGTGNDTLGGGSSKDTLTGGTGADTMRGMNGNDTLLARDLTSDTLVNCDGGTTSGTADKADLDLLPKDPNAAVVGCETKTRH